jgi:phosphoglucosamine mutase
LLEGVVLYPQTMINVRVDSSGAWRSRPALGEATRAVERELGESGRVLIRPSGTEPVVRVMVEAADAARARACAERIAATLA